MSFKTRHLPKRKVKLKVFKFCFLIGTDFNVFVENDARSLLLRQCYLVVFSGNDSVYASSQEKEKWK